METQTLIGLQMIKIIEIKRNPRGFFFYGLNYRVF